MDKDAYAWKKLVEAAPQVKVFRDARKKGEAVIRYKFSIRNDVSENPEETISHETIENRVDLLGPGKANVLAKLDGHDWADLLVSQPGYAENADLSVMVIDDWDKVLEAHPQLEKYRPPLEGMKFASLDGAAWAELLSKHPEFASRCAWGKLKNDDWTDLLKAQPQFADKCGNISSYYIWFNLFMHSRSMHSECLEPIVRRVQRVIDGMGWRCLLEDHPEFADRCNWGKLDGRDWSRLLAVQPQFADRCNWGKLDGSGWSSLLAVQPQFADRCDWGKLDGGDWSRLLAAQPQFADQCDLGKLDGGGWSNLLKKHPEFADRCEWNKLDEGDWSDLLEDRPEFADRCDKWDVFEESEWVCLLKARPEFADRCDMWDSFTASDWCTLLKYRPEYADRCDWEKLNGDGWCELLKARPEFADLCDWDKANGAYLRAKRELLVERPEFIDRCAWKLDRGDWICLFWKHPEFVAKCPQAFRNFDEFTGSDWATLLQIPAVVNRLRVEAVEVEKAMKPSAPATTSAKKKPTSPQL